MVGGECCFGSQARIFLKRSQGHADTCASEHDPASVPRVEFEPTGNGVEIEDCSALAVVSKGTVPPGVNLPTSNLESGRPTVKALKIFGIYM